MNGIIVARILGGLGNQLFGYAAARRLALLHGAELILDHVTGFTHDSYNRHYQLDYFSIPCRKASSLERLEPFSRFRRKLLLVFNQGRPFEMRTYLKQEQVDFDSRLLTIRPRPNLYLEGYWQSEDYFKDVEPQIRQDLRIYPPSDSTNLALAERIRQQVAVAVHVRFFDEPDVANGIGANNAPQGYYQRALETMEARVKGAHYLLFSNRPEAARRVIPLPDDRVTLVHNNKGDENAYADLWLMQQCQHFIIANSTFSWWGAWLASNQGKIVIAPGFEKRDGESWWGFEGLIPEGWIKC
ncbi:MAG: alpha-1,2-fucosyltransferase [Gallionella sp.]|nr:alpha-1,2-fucosyltransferase [Gallionella sp.]